MNVITKTDSILYLSDAGDWGLRVTNETKEILPQVGDWFINPVLILTILRSL